MKTFTGNASNIYKPVIGIITRKRHIIKDKYIFISSKGNAIKGYQLIINSSFKADSNVPTIFGVENISELNEGDIVLASPSGEINVLFDSNSVHNSIFVTDLCNQRCIMCPQPPLTKEENKLEQNLKLISLMNKKTSEIGITGGEPTLIGEDLFIIMKAIQRRFPNARVCLLSNGVRFSDLEYVQKLHDCGLKNLQVDVPIFSDIADVHNHIVGAHTFYKMVQGLYNLALYKIQIGIRIVIHKQTYERLPQLADYIYHNFPFVSQVAFMQMETTGLAQKNIEDLWIDPYDYNTELQEAISILDSRGIPALIYNAQMCVLPENLRSFSVNAITDWKDKYLPECNACNLREHCGGLFESNINYKSTHIKAIK